MSWQLVYFLIVCIACSVWRNVDSEFLAELDARDDAVLQSARFAVDELSKLSHSNVYSTLKLERVLKAFDQEGIYHQNRVLNLELSSPHFMSGGRTENFTMVVLTHHDDGAKSIAIDEFPVMREEAIEDFYIAKVKKRRVARDLSFVRLKLKALLTDRQDRSNGSGTTTSYEEIEKLRESNVTEQLAFLTPSNFEDMRRRESWDFLAGQDAVIAAQEQELQRHSDHELLEIAVGLTAASDFHVFRARQIILDLLLE